MKGFENIPNTHFILSDVKINDFRTKEGWEKIAHTNPYNNLQVYHFKTKGTKEGNKYPPEIDYFVERIPSRQKVDCYLHYAVYSDEQK